MVLRLNENRFLHYYINVIMKYTRKRLSIVYTCMYWDKILWEYDTQKEAKQSFGRCWDYETQHTRRNPDFVKWNKDKLLTN